MRRDDGADAGDDARFVRHVNRRRGGVPSLIAQRLGVGLSGRGVAIGDDHLGAGPGQRLGDAGADADGAPRNHRDLAGEAEAALEKCCRHQSLEISFASKVSGAGGGQPGGRRRWGACPPGRT
jgi:hypothetical protein